MIEGQVNYVEKGTGLHDAVSATGHYLFELDGMWIGGGPLGPAYVQAIIDMYQAPQAPRVIPKSLFKMRIPPQKYGALRDLAQADSSVWAFLDVLNDVTLTEVDLDSPYLAGAMQYLLQTYPQLITTADVAAWTA